MVRCALAGLFAFAISFAAGQDLPAPGLPYYDWKACPFEGCTYGKWTAQIPVTVFDTWQDNRHAVGKIQQGQSIQSLNGVVITFRPGMIRLDRDLPGDSLKQGDLISTYAFRGEGFSAVWFHGRYYPEFDISFTKWPDGTGCGGAHCAATYVDLGKKEWWVEVKLASGISGWVDMEQTRVSGVYMLRADRY